MSESELTTELVAATRCWREKAERRKERFEEYVKDLDRRNDKFRKLQKEIQEACYLISQCPKRTSELDAAARKLEAAADKLLFDCFCHCKNNIDGD